MGSVSALGYLGLAVSDLEAWRQYASDFLGLAVMESADGGLDLRCDDHAFRLRLHPGGNDDIAYIGWEVADADALDSLKRRLSAAGVAFTEASPEAAAAKHVEGLITLTDCDGIRTEVVFGSRGEPDVPFVSPLGLCFRTGGLGMGHIVINSADPERAVNWYREVLGLRLSDTVHAEPIPGLKIDLSFLRCNARHHSLALTHAPFLPKRLQHFMLEVKDIDAVGRALDRARAMKIHIALTLGRHSKDRMLSAYYLTPSGFEVEFGCDGLDVDETNWEVQSLTSPSDWGHHFQPPPGVAGGARP